LINYIEFPSWLKPEILPGILPFRWYAVMYLVAFGITYILFRRQVKAKGLDISKDQTGQFFTFLIVGLMLGARLFGTLVYTPDGYYWTHPWEIFWPFNRDGSFGFQGLSYHGGFVGALVGALIYTRWKKIDLLQWSDMIVYGVPLGYTFGRLGNFINGELYGRVTTVPWGMIFPTGSMLSVREPWVKEVMAQTGIPDSAVINGMVNLPRHPSQLYEAFSEGILIFLIFWLVFSKRDMFKGFYLSAYIIGYGVARFVVEYLRTPDAGMDFPIMLDPQAIMNSQGGILTSHLIISPWNFSTGQIFSFLMILGGVIAMIVFSQMGRRQKSLKKTSH